MKNRTQKRNVKPKWLMVLLWVIAFPIMLLVALVKGIIVFVKTPQIKKNTKIVIAAVVAVIVAIDMIIVGGDEKSLSDGASSDDSIPTQSISDNTGEDTHNNVDNSKSNTEDYDDLFSDVLTDEALRNDFISACGQIGIEAKKIKDLKQVSDWVGGTQYTFTYNSKDLILYCNMDSSIETIRLGGGVALYQRGFEPYQLEDYSVSLSMGEKLQTQTKDLVKTQLNYPSTAKFPTYDWSYGREQDIYTIASYVTAENAFGVKSEVQFTVIYQIDGDSVNPIYFKLGDDILIDNRSSVSVQERKEIGAVDREIVPENSGINLTYGELGEYGKTVTLDGENCINYCVPIGTYTVTNNVNYCKVYLASDNYTKNSDGYMENEIIETLEFTKSGEEKTITVSVGQHLELTLYARIVLTPVE